MKTFIAVIAAVVVVASGERTHHKKHDQVASYVAKKGKAQGDELDPALCVGKFDENVYHPVDCTKYVACTNQRAIEMDCGGCNMDIPGSCQGNTGRLVFTLDSGEPEYGECVHAYETQCHGGGSSTTEQAPSSTTEDNGNECDPDLCETEGYCQHYRRCDKETKKWVEEFCGKDLVWNPRGDGAIHGGNCDLWKNLDQDIVDQYRSDPECLACFWKETGECQREYWYQAPGLTNRDPQKLSCADGLVFSLPKETCQRCEDVNKADGTPCC